MLEDDIREEIEEHLDELPTSRSACVEALMAVQRHHGWVDDERLGEVAQMLEMSVDELDAIATFYNLIYRRPVGEHVILVCDSVSCWLTGYDDVRQALSDELEIGLGETTDDGRFTLLPICCLGACDRAPVLMVGEETHVDVTPEGVPELLAEYGGE